MIGRKEKHQTLPPASRNSGRGSRSRGKKASLGRKGSKVKPSVPAPSHRDGTSITREVITGADGTILFQAYVIPSPPHPPSSRGAALTDFLTGASLKVMMRMMWYGRIKYL
ncbi:hypothetical protein LguiA_003379 [Lonicera macranthoides]